MPQAPDAQKPISQAPSSSPPLVVENRYTGAASSPSTTPIVAAPRRPPHRSESAPRATEPISPPALSNSRNESGCSFNWVSSVGYQNVVLWYIDTNPPINNEV